MVKCQFDICVKTLGFLYSYSYKLIHVRVNLMRVTTHNLIRLINEVEDDDGESLIFLGLQHLSGVRESLVKPPPGLYLLRAGAVACRRCCRGA